MTETTQTTQDGVVRVLVVDDYRIYRRGLRTVLELETDIQVIGEAGSAAEAVQAVLELQPDVVLMDIYLPAGNGIEACAQVKEAAPDTQILMITASDDAQDLAAAVAAGATGYLLKDIDPDALVAAIRGAARREPQLSPQLGSTLMTRYAALVRGAPDTQDGPQLDLTERELQVLELVAAGLSNRAVGAQLFISENTVRNHVRKILEKLGLSSRVEAATYAERHGLTGRSRG